MRKFIKNFITGFGTQILIIALGIIIPRIMITNYGSDTNGLISTIGQVFTYLALLESGIGQASKNALYKSQSSGNVEETSDVISASHKYYKKVTIYYAFCVLLLSSVLPFVLRTQLSRITVFFLVFLEGISNVISFRSVQTKNIFLAVDGKNYINNYVDFIFKLAMYICKICMACLGMNIIFLQLANLVFTIIKVSFYEKYFKTHYRWFHYNKDADCRKLKDRNAFIIGEIAWTVFSSTDLIVLSMFVSTRMASVYSVYNMIFSNINIMLNTVFINTNYILARKYHSDFDHYAGYHDLFNSLFLGLMTSFMSVAYILIIPFVKIYTKGILDTNYINYSLPILFCLIQIISWGRYVSGNLFGISGNVRKMIIPNIIEAGTNVFLSVILVNSYGISGVLLATVIALPLKCLYCNYYADKKIMNRSICNTMKILGTNLCCFVFIARFSQFISLTINSYRLLFIYSVCLTGLCLMIVFLANIVINPQLAKQVIEILKEKFK